MSAKKSSVSNLRTWIEIDSRAARKNYDTFRKLLGKRVKLWAVVKSNAYGHGLMLFAKLMQKFGIDGFCVDSLVEGLRLRKEGIKKSILVLGPTLPALYKDAAAKNITISISNFEALKALAREKTPPSFHIKIDTGMHRQGFYLNDLPKAIKIISSSQSSISKKFTGIFTHFASAKDINYPTYTERQFAEFQKAAKLFEKAGFKNLIKHVAATGGALVNPKYHLDAVRVGIGLYGLWPSKELETQFGTRIHLKPILRWRAVVSEVKHLKGGDYVGYDLVERVREITKMAVIPVGYWHGFPRSLSGTGEILVNGRRARVLGRVSMDLTTVNLGNAKCDTGAVVTLIGRDGDEELSAAEVAARAGTIHYELLTRLNPLIERTLIQ
jgi:alanine racemase